MAAVGEVLSRMRLFAGMTPEDLQQVEKLVFVNRFSAGDVVCREGDHSDFMCFVVRGRLDIIKRGQGDHDVVIAHLRAGDSLGEMALIDHEPRSASALASEDSTVIVLTRKGFEQLRKRSPQAAHVILMNIARLLSGNLRRTSAQLAQYMLPLN